MNSIVRAIAILSAVLLAPELTNAASINWTSTTFSISENSVVGRSGSTWTSGIPGGFSTIEAQDPQSASLGTLPVPGPADTDVLNSAQLIDLGFPNERQASSAAKLTGNPMATIQVFSSAGSRSKNTNLYDQTIKTEGTSNTTFAGEFQSLGADLELAFDGVYDLFAFHQNQLLPYQRAEALVSVLLSVVDLTSSSTLLSETIFSDSRIQTSFGVSSLYDAPFSGSRSIDLSGTAGHDISVTLTASVSATWYGRRRTSEPSSYGAAGATSSAGFQVFNSSFPAVPEPSAALLLATGLAGLAAAGRRRSLH